MTTSTFSSVALSWLLTYLVHSTVLLGIAWLATRARRMTPSAAEVIWKSAMIGSLVTASMQLTLDLRPVGTLALHRAEPVLNAAPMQHGDEPVGLAKISAEPMVGLAPTSASSEASIESKPATAWPPADTLALATWSVIALALGGAYAARRLILAGRLGDRELVDDAGLLEMLGVLARGAHVNTPRLTVTNRVSSPIALGRREVCLPTSALTDLDGEQQRSMLAHELAHLARRDPMWLAIVSVIERVFWLQPLNRVARREITTAAEFLCDEWAVRRTGSGLALASCLAQVAEWIQASPLGVPMAGMAEERSLLVTRVSRLLEDKMPTTTSRRVITLTAIAVLLGAIVMVPSVSGKAPTMTQDGGSVGERNRPKTGRNVDAQLEAVVEGTSASVARMMRDMAPALAPGRERRTLSAADSGVVVALIARLKDEDAGVRQAAARSLGKLEDARAVPGLVDALKDGDNHVRAAAAEALGQFKDPRALSGLLKAVEDPSIEVRQNALEALSDYEDAVPAAPIIRLLDDKDADIRHKAVHLLGQIHDKSAAPALVRLLKDSSAEVRQSVIEALGELHDATSVNAILSALKDGNADVRGSALGALEELHAGIPEATMLGLLKDQNADVRSKAARLAGDRSMVGTVSALVSLLEDANADVRESAVQALGNMADNSAHEGLRKALSSKDAKVRRAAVEALGERRP